MQSKAKSNSVCTAVFNREANTLTIKVLGAGEAVCNLSAVSTECKFEGFVRGMSQRLTNMAALPHDKATGKPATPAEKFAAVKRAVDHYNSGTVVWNIKPDETFDSGLIIQAMVRAKVATDAEIANQYADKLALARGIDRAAALRQWALVGVVAEAKVVIENERAKERAKAANVNVEDLMAELAKAAKTGEPGGETGGDESEGDESAPEGDVAPD